MSIKAGAIHSHLSGKEVGTLASTLHLIWRRHVNAYHLPRAAHRSVGALLVGGNSLIMASVADGPVMLVYAIFSLAAGLAIILGHNVWSGGTLPVIVTWNASPAC
jgi:hypothetical protein